VLLPSSFANLMACKERSPNPEACDEARPRRPNIPIARDLDGIFLGKDRVEDWLLREARRKFSIARGADQLKLFGADGAVKCDGL
jgi:hypothetical protein